MLGFVALLAERLLPTQGKTFNQSVLSVNCIETTKIKKKRPGMAQFKEMLWTGEMTKASLKDHNRWFKVESSNLGMLVSSSFSIFKLTA